MAHIPSSNPNYEITFKSMVGSGRKYALFVSVPTKQVYTSLLPNLSSKKARVRD